MSSNKADKWRDDLTSLSERDISIEQGWEFIKDIFDVKTFIKLTEKTLEKDDDLHVYGKIQNIFRWCKFKRPNCIKAVIVIEKYYPWELSLLSELDNNLKKDGEILILPLSYYNITKCRNKIFFLNFVVEVINHLSSLSDNKIILCLMIKNEDANYITNIKNLGDGRVVIIVGRSLGNDNSIEENEKVISLFKLLVKDSVIEF